MSSWEVHLGASAVKDDLSGSESQGKDFYDELSVSDSVLAASGGQAATATANVGGGATSSLHATAQSASAGANGSAVAWGDIGGSAVTLGLDIHLPLTNGSGTGDSSITDGGGVYSGFTELTSGAGLFGSSAVESGLAIGRTGAFANVLLFNGDSKAKADWAVLPIGSQANVLGRGSWQGETLIDDPQVGSSYRAFGTVNNSTSTEPTSVWVAGNTTGANNAPTVSLWGNSLLAGSSAGDSPNYNYRATATGVGVAEGNATNYGLIDDVTAAGRSRVDYRRNDPSMTVGTKLDATNLYEGSAHAGSTMSPPGGSLTADAYNTVGTSYSVPSDREAGDATAGGTADTDVNAALGSESVEGWSSVTAANGGKASGYTTASGQSAALPARRAGTTTSVGTDYSAAGESTADAHARTLGSSGFSGSASGNTTSAGPLHEDVAVSDASATATAEPGAPMSATASGHSDVKPTSESGESNYDATADVDIDLDIGVLSSMASQKGLSNANAYSRAEFLNHDSVETTASTRGLLDGVNRKGSANAAFYPGGGFEASTSAATLQGPFLQGNGIGTVTMDRLVPATFVNGNLDFTFQEMTLSLKNADTTISVGPKSTVQVRITQCNASGTPLPGGIDVSLYARFGATSYGNAFESQGWNPGAFLIDEQFETATLRDKTYSAAADPAAGGYVEVTVYMESIVRQAIGYESTSNSVIV